MATTKSQLTHQELLDSLDVSHVPKPFRNPHWKPSNRRNKTLKQILAENSRKEAALLSQANADAEKEKEKDKDKDAFTAKDEKKQAPPPLPQPSAFKYTYVNIESAPSLKASGQRHYCDITGLPAPYTDPKTRLRYHDREVFGVVRTLGPGVAESYLEARGAHFVLR